MKARYLFVQICKNTFTMSRCFVE